MNLGVRALQSFDATHGAETLSSFLSAALFGFTFLQTYTYFLHRSSNDPLPMKLGIALLWIVDFFQVLFIVWAVYWYLVQNFFQPSVLGTLHWPIAMTWFMASAGSFIAELYFLPQIWTLSQKNKSLTGLIGLTSIAQYAASLVVFVHMIIHLDKGLTITLEGNRTPIIIQQIFAIVSNNAIVVALCLYNYRPNEGIFGGASPLDGLLIILFDRGLLSGVLQVVYLLVYVFEGDNLLWFPFHVATSKLLVNAILAKLNSRDTKITRKPVDLNLGHLGGRPTVMPLNDQVVVVTKTVVESETPSVSSMKDDLEGQPADVIKE